MVPRQVAVEAVFQFNHNLAKLALGLLSVRVLRICTFLACLYAFWAHWNCRVLGALLMFISLLGVEFSPQIRDGWSVTGYLPLSTM